MLDLKALTQLQKRIIFALGLAGIAAIVIQLLGPFIVISFQNPFRRR